MNALTLQGTDVGSPRLRGSTRQTETAVEIVAGGEDIWGVMDEFHFAHIMVSGDFEFSARIASLTMADVYTKAGLMLRTSLEGGAEHAMLLAFGDNQPRNKNNGGLEFQYRESANGSCTGVYPPQPLPVQPDFPASFPDVWLKLIRDGDTITGQSSQDGVSWRTFCIHHQRLPHTAYLGLAVTSHNATHSVRGAFSHLTLLQTT